MKKIINGKLYNTVTAKKLAEQDFGSRSDLNWREETLYQKKTGEYFLHGTGNAASKYAEEAGQNTWGPGERIIPLEYEAAREWAEESLDADVYESLFELLPDGEDKELIGLSMPADIVAKLRRDAAQAGLTVSEFVTQLERERVK